MNNRVVLTAFALLVIGGLVALIVAIGAGGDEPETRQVARADQPTDSPSQPTADRSRTRPAIDDGADTPAAPEGREPVIYMTDAGQLVRDHRADPTKPAHLDKVPAPTRTDRKMQSASVLAVRHALRPIVRDCQRGLPTDQLGDNPRLQAVLTVSVAAEKLTVDGVDLQVSDAPAGVIEDCIRTRFAGWQGSVPDEPDIEGFKLTYPFRLNP